MVELPPITTTVIMSIFRRPTRSPKCPAMAPPINAPMTASKTLKQALMRALTGAGSTGLSRLPDGTSRVRSRRLPALTGTSCPPITRVTAVVTAETVLPSGELTGLAA